MKLKVQTKGISKINKLEMTQNETKTYENWQFNPETLNCHLSDVKSNKPLVVVQEKVFDERQYFEKLKMKLKHAKIDNLAQKR